VKTIKEAAGELNISTQALYKKINKTYKNELAPYVQVQHNQKLIDQEGIELLKNGVANLQLQPIVDVADLQSNKPKSFQRCESTENTVANLQASVSEEIANLKNELIERVKKENENLFAEVQGLKKELTAEREHNRVQAERFADISEKLAELTRNSQVLLKQEQDKNTRLLSDERPPNELESDTQETKKSLWQKLFKAKKIR